MIVVFVFLNRLFPQLLSLRIHFFSQLLSVYLCCLGYLFFLVFLLIRAGLDMRPVDKNCAGIYHSIIQCFVQDMLKNLARQFLR